MFRRPTAARLADYGLTIPAVAVALLAGVLTLRSGAAPLSVAPLALVVALSAWYGGFGPGLFALVQAAVSIDFFLVEPGSVLRFSSSAQAAAYVVFVAGWVIFCLLAERVYRQLQRDR